MNSIDRGTGRTHADSDATHSLADLGAAWLLRHLPFGVVLCQQVCEAGHADDWAFLDSNPAFDTMTGLGPVRGRRLSDVVARTGESGPPLFETFGRVAAGQPAEPVELFMPAAENWFSVRVQCPAPGRVLAFFDAITTRKQLERSLADVTMSDERFRAMLEQAPVGGALFDGLTGTILAANPLYAEITGVPREGLVGATWMRMTDAADLQHGQDLLAKLLAGEIQVARIEKRYVRPDGSRRWSRVTVAPLQVGVGAGRPCLAVIDDITERKAAEDAVREANQRVNLALRAADLGVWDWSLPDGKIVWDERICEIYGLPSEVGSAGVTYDFWRSRVHPQDVGRLEDSAQGNRFLPSATRLGFRIVRPDGTIRHVESAAVAELDDDDHPVRVLGVNRDVTEQSQLEASLRDASHAIEVANADLRRNREELETTVVQRTRELVRALDQAESASRAKNAFLATTSHELRTPLNAVIGFSALLLDGEMGEIQDQQRQPLAIIRRSGEQLLELVQEILDLTSIEAGNLVVASAPLNLRQVIEEQLEAMQPRAVERHLELRPVVCDQSIYVTADHKRLGQVMRNLVSNALKFTDGGHVEIRAAVRDGMALVEVEDTGIGIPDDQRAKLFRAFQPIEGQPGPLRQGTGLGLAISKRIVEAMGGKIGVDSVPGRGSIFWFTVPLSIAPT